MSELDRELFDIAKRIHIMGKSDQLIGIKEHYSDEQLKEFVVSVKQAFADDGKHVPTEPNKDGNSMCSCGKVYNKTYMRKHTSQYMTGQEWYDRFKAEVDKDYDFLTGNYEIAALDAARLAAGIKEIDDKA